MKSQSRKIRLTHNFKETTPKVSYNPGVSKTIPDQSMTIKEFLKNSMSGISSDDLREGTFLEDPDFDSVDLSSVMKMDIIDRSQLLEDIGNKISDIKRKIDELNNEENEVITQTKETKKTRTNEPVKEDESKDSDPEEVESKEVDEK